ncbi:Fimbrial periplasmic chaperone SfmC, partial [Salmonella enterica subsp. enterica serovar Gaminara str. A4-567]
MRRRHLAWFIPDSLSGFFSRLLGGEKGALRASLRYYADEKKRT